MGSAQCDRLGAPQLVPLEERQGGSASVPVGRWWREGRSGVCIQGRDRVMRVDASRVNHSGVVYLRRGRVCGGNAIGATEVCLEWWG